MSEQHEYELGEDEPNVERLPRSELTVCVHLSADDADMVFMKLRNGLHASIVHAGYKTRGVDKCEVEVTCTNGMLKFDSYSNQLAVDQAGVYKPILVQRLEPFAEELKNLVGAINGTEQLKVTPAWGRHIVEVLLAAEESSRSGREVQIPQRVAATAGSAYGRIG